MYNKKKLMNSLHTILENNNLLSHLPIENNNKIIIKHCLIEKNKDNFKIEDLKLKKIVCYISTKSAALAFAKVYTQAFGNSKSLKDIKDLDYIIEKNSVDCIFYKHTITNTNNKILKESVRTRLNLAKVDIDLAKKELHKIIFDVDKYL